MVDLLDLFVYLVHKVDVRFSIGERVPCLAGLWKRIFLLNKKKKITITPRGLGVDVQSKVTKI